MEMSIPEKKTMKTDFEESKQELLMELHTIIQERRYVVESKFFHNFFKKDIKILRENLIKLIRNINSGDNLNQNTLIFDITVFLSNIENLNCGDIGKKLEAFVEKVYHLNERHFKAVEIMDEWLENETKNNPDNHINIKTFYDEVVSCILKKKTSINGKCLGLNSLPRIGEFVDFSHITKIDISHNNISDESFQYFIGNSMSQVNEVDISHNKFISLSFIKNIPKLKKLHANNNKINSFKNMVEHINIIFLNLKNNQISSFNNFPSCLLLKEINLKHNLIGNMESFNPYKFIFLEKLNLEYNRIQQFPENFFKRTLINELGPQSIILRFNGNPFCGDYIINEILGFEDSALSIFQIDLITNELRNEDHLGRCFYRVENIEQFSIEYNRNGITPPTNQHINQINQINDENYGIVKSHINSFYHLAKKAPPITAIFYEQDHFDWKNFLSKLKNTNDFNNKSEKIKSFFINNIICFLENIKDNQELYNEIIDDIRQLSTSCSDGALAILDTVLKKMHIYQQTNNNGPVNIKNVLIKFRDLFLTDKLKGIIGEIYPKAGEQVEKYLYILNKVIVKFKISTKEINMKYSDIGELSRSESIEIMKRLSYFDNRKEFISYLVNEKIWVNFINSKFDKLNLENIKNELDAEKNIIIERQSLLDEIKDTILSDVFIKNCEIIDELDKKRANGLTFDELVRLNDKNKEIKISDLENSGWDRNIHGFEIFYKNSPDSELTAHSILSSKNLEDLRSLEDNYMRKITETLVLSII